MKHMLITILIVLLSTSQVQGLPGGLGNCPSGPSFGKNVDLIHKATMVGGEGRQTLGQFAGAYRLPMADAKKMFAATGVMVCGAITTTVQLSGNKNLVTGVSHAFNQIPVCKAFEPTDCTVQFPLTGSEKFYKIKAGSMKSGGCALRDFTKDWSVFELIEDVSGATPYDVPPTWNEVPPGSAVVQVASTANNFHPELPATAASHYNIQHCQIRDRGAVATAGVKTDCDTGVGASGAGQLAALNGRLTLIAINVAQTKTLPSGSEYHPQNHYNFSVALEGDFLSELHSRINTRLSSGQQ